MRLSSTPIFALAALVGAIQITEPGSGDSVIVSQDWPVCWNYVQTDPASFCLYLTNYKEYPPQTFFLRQVTTAWNCASVTGRCYPGLRSSGYRVWASRCGDPMTIFAESGDFSAHQQSCLASNTDSSE